MKLRYIIIIAGISVFLIAAAVTNPTKDDYVEWMSEAISEDEGFGILSFFSRPIIRNTTTSQDYGVLSVYNTKLNDGSTVKTIGMFNNFLVINQS